MAVSESIEVPRYLISKKIWLAKIGIVIRGHGLTFRDSHNAVIKWSLRSLPQSSAKDNVLRLLFILPRTRGYITSAQAKSQHAETLCRGNATVCTLLYEA